MGLDMYLEGRKFLWGYGEIKRPTEDGFEVKYKYLELGYWRKHPNLHGYIVETFASGVDECQDIDLSAEDLQTIINAVRTKALPHTEGFFFGESDGTEDEETIQIFEKAIAWLKDDAHNKTESRSVAYRASW